MARRAIIAMKAGSVFMGVEWMGGLGICTVCVNNNISDFFFF